MLHHAFGEVNGKKGVWGHAIGGWARSPQAMARAARGHGVDIELDAGVREVIVEGDRAVGVILDNGETDARKIRRPPSSIRNLLYTRLVPSGALAADFLDRYQPLAQRLRHLSDERGAERPALVLGACRAMAIISPPGSSSAQA
jgi:phytoene dehydrogenase-like protein